jgi:hypothetical protein
VSTVPFFIADIWQGLLRGHGLVNLQDHAFRLEIQIVDSLTGLLKIKHLVHEAPLADVASISMRSYLGGLYTVLSVQGTRMDVFAGFPRARGGRCRLRIARRDRQSCAALVERFAKFKAAAPQLAAA